MNSRMMPWLASLSLLLPLAGCRVASLEGKKISSPPAAAEESGLVYYLTQPQFAVEVKDRHDNKKAEPVYDLKVTFVPDPAQRYAVRLKTGSVTNDVLKLQLREDGRLISVGSKSEDQTPEIVKALGSLTASALTFSQLGLPILQTLAGGPEDLQKALDDGVCVGQISAQEYVDLLCVEQQLANPTSDCSIDVKELTCPALVLGGEQKKISLPQPAEKLKSLEDADQDVLSDLSDLIGRLIQVRERILWRMLDQKVEEAGLPELEDNVVASQGRLAALRTLEARLARRLGREPRHQTLEPPSPRQFEVERIGENLDRVLTRRVQEARKHIPEDKASHELSDDEKNTLKGDREHISALAAVAAPVSSDPLARQIAKLEGKIRGRFESREFHDPLKVQTAETESLRDYRTVILLQELRAQLAKAVPPGPRDEIASDLKKKRDEAERQYARFVRGLVSKKEFEETLAAYSKAVDRLVAFDERLGATSLTNRRDTLTEFLSRPIAPTPAPTGNESKAFRDFREEHDKVTGEIGARVGGLIDPKKPEEPLSLGSQTSRRLEETVSCVIDCEAQIHEKGGRLLLLADIWTKYGKKDAVVLRARNDRQNKGNRVNCGRDLFGGSPNAAADGAQGGTSPSSNAAAGGAQEGTTPSSASSAFQESGMHVRRLRAEDLKDGMMLQGVLVQVPAPYTVITVLQGPAGDRVLKTTTLSLPADDEFLDIGFSGKWLRARELNVKVHASGGLDEYTFDTKQKIDKGAQSLAEATDAVTKSLQEIEKAEKEAAPPDPVTAENTELELTILNLMLKANLDAVREGRPLPYPDLFD